MFAGAAAGPGRRQQAQIGVRPTARQGRPHKRRGYLGVGADMTIKRGNRPGHIPKMLEHGLNPRPRVDQIADQLAEHGFRGAIVDHRQGRRQWRVGGGGGARAGKYLGAGRRRQLGRAERVKHLKLRRDPGLQRKAPQHRLAEPVDGLDFHPAGHVQDPREQTARTQQFVLVGLPAKQLRQSVVQRRLVGDRPFGQTSGDPHRHFGRRRLGEGQT